MSEKPLFVDTPLPSPITEFAIQISSNVEGQDHYASGTGVIIAPRLALAARHVLEDHWKRHHKEPMPLEGDITTRFSLVLAQLVKDKLNAWAVTRLWSSPQTDIMVLRLTPYSDGAQKYRFRPIRIDLLPPRVGERIHAFGYSESEVIESGLKKVTLKQRAASTHGEVIEVFHNRRDPIKMPFPCFRTNARFDGGMSGGPVFNQAGLLCGLICSSFPPFSADEEHASYIASLWPVMGMPIDLDRVGHPAGVRYPVFDLVRENIIAALNADRVTIGPLPEIGSAPVSLDVPNDRL